MSIILTILIIIGFFIIGIRLWKKSRILSIFLSIPVFLALLFVGYVVFNSWYHTTPDSLEFSVQKENQTYTVTGVWKKPLDAYRFPIDFIVFYTRDDVEVSNVERDRYKDYKKMDLVDLEKTVQYWIEEEKNLAKGEPQIFDLETSKKFSFSFVLPENIKLSDVKMYYAHTRAEPMDSLEVWFKKIELK